MPLITGKKNVHQVLTVGDRPEQTRDVGPVLDQMEIKFFHVTTGEQGLKALESALLPFSLVICDQRLNGMKGTRFLAQVKEIAPDTIRFLITGYSDMETIISAVNQGAVHRYISVPWHEDQMAEAVQSGITRYEHHLESDRLFALAKAQNGQLYELNCELMETGKVHDQESKTIEKDIAAIKAKLKQKTAQRSLPPKQIMKHILNTLQEKDKDNPSKLNNLYTHSIASLHMAFTDFALRNGMEMPESDAGNTNG